MGIKDRFTINRNKETADEQGFNANVRSSEPILTLNDSALAGGWKSELLLNISCGALLLAFLSLFCMAAELPELIPFAIPCPVIFIAMTTAESFVPGRVKWIAAGVLAAILAVTAAIWHTRVFGGLALAINQFYDLAEEAQAYLYDRFSIGDSASDTDSMIGVVWISVLTGLIASLPPARFRRSVGILFAVLAMFAFAYYGLIPSWICMGALLAALLLTSARGSILSILPVVLAAMLIFGITALTDPGENYGISRVDENFRDRFALHTSYLESIYQSYDDMSVFGDENDPDAENEERKSVLDSTYAPYFIGGIIFLIIAALAAALIMYRRRLSKRRAALMAGLDSPDPRTAVVAMFPYSVRWLRAFGVAPGIATFSGMLPAVRSEFPDNYARRYSDMYELWSEAAYSEHDVTEETRRDMDSFMKDTIERVTEKCGFREKMRLATRYALWQGKGSSGKKNKVKKEKKRLRKKDNSEDEQIIV